MSLIIHQCLFPVRDYDLAATLDGGQAFRWTERDGAWVGVVGSRWVRLRAQPDGILAETVVRGQRGPGGGAAARDPIQTGGASVPASRTEWRWLAHFLQTGLDLDAVLRTFPDDEPMRTAVARCRGLRLLRQEPWECLASFILSSTKQIVQIRQIIALLCECYGEPLATAPDWPPAFTFPSPARLARATEAELRACKMGFRAPYLLATARLIADGRFDLVRLQPLPVELARSELMNLPGVGRKIADCVLLFAFGFQSAFPVDIWVTKALRQLYFPRRRASLQRLHRFAATYFGPRAGYAQQYLFHYIRTRGVA
jgi:N-glycosylase/DNA lyase